MVWHNHPHTIDDMRYSSQLELSTIAGNLFPSYADAFGDFRAEHLVFGQLFLLEPGFILWNGFMRNHAEIQGP